MTQSTAIFASSEMLSFARARLTEVNVQVPDVPANKAQVGPLVNIMKAILENISEGKQSSIISIDKSDFRTRIENYRYHNGLASASDNKLSTMDMYREMLKTIYPERHEVKTSVIVTESVKAEIETSEITTSVSIPETPVKVKKTIWRRIKSKVSKIFKRSSKKSNTQSTDL